MKVNHLLLLFTLCSGSLPCFSQKGDTTKSVYHLSGVVGLTNNGISIVPSFSLGKPAWAINLSAGKGKLSFEPELDFSIDAKPWQFLFWWRYKLLNAEKFKVGIGTHLAISFRNDSIVSNGVAKKGQIANRFVVAEISPNYIITKNISVGLYYLYSRGLQEPGLKNGHYVSSIGNFSNIKLANKILLELTPQLYYLKLDSEDGFYFASSFAIKRENFPLFLSAIINKKLNSNITGSKDFIWNTSLVYSFGNSYVKQ